MFGDRIRQNSLTFSTVLVYLIIIIITMIIKPQKTIVIHTVCHQPYDSCFFLNLFLLFVVAVKTLQLR